MAANHIRNDKRYKAQNINVDGVVKSSMGWALSLHHSDNFINKYRKKHGEEATIAYIRKALQDGTVERNIVKKQRKIPKMYPYGRIKDRDIASVFNAMIQRCYDEKHSSYPCYGGRGITVCGLWLQHPEEYEQWAIASGYKKGQTIDRIDPDKDYCPENCRFLTKSENAKWQRGTHKITLNGITDSGAGWDMSLKLRRGWVNYQIRKYGMEATLRKLQLLLDEA